MRRITLPALALLLPFLAAGATATFVAVGAGGSTITSPDGIDWTDARELKAVSYGGGIWVAVGERGAILTSPDAITWSVRDSGTLQTLFDVEHDGSMWVAAGMGGTVLTSNDGKTWTSQCPGLPGCLAGNFEGIEFDGTQWIFVRGYNAGVPQPYILTSPGSPSWTMTLRNAGTTTDMNEVESDGTNLVAVGHFGNIRESSDGVTWTPSASPTGGIGIYEDVATDGSQWVIVGDSTGKGLIFMKPSGGAAWTDRSNGLKGYLSGVAADASQWVIVGGSGLILSSPDAVNWLPQASGTNNHLQAVGTDGSTWVAVGQAGLILSSYDAITWTQRAGSIHSKDMADVAHGNGRWVAVGADGATATTVNEVEWFVNPSSTTQQLTGVAFDGTRWTAVGWSGAIQTSPNGVTWTTQCPGGAGTGCMTSSLRGIATDGNTWVAVGNTGRIYTSPDGSAWTLRASTVTTQLNRVAHSGGYWVAVGVSGTILTSMDTVSWTKQTVPTTCQFNGIAANATHWIAVCESGVVWTSKDTITWTTQPTLGVPLRDVATDGLVWVTVGSLPNPASAIPFGSIRTTTTGTGWVARASYTPLALQAVASSVLPQPYAPPPPPPPPLPPFTLTSSAFEDGDEIPYIHTCDGYDISPPLAMDDLPPGTNRLALTMVDLDAAGAEHWTLWDLHATATDLATNENIPALGGTEGSVYAGPCPPMGVPHTYRFTAYALSAPLGLASGSDMDELTAALAGKVLAEDTLDATYERLPILACAPAFQVVSVHDKASLTATGGTGAYAWTAPGADDPTGTTLENESFLADYAFDADYTVLVRSANMSATCQVQVFWPCGPLQADFFPSTLRTIAGRSVVFEDQSHGDIESWSWDFGDGSVTSERNAIHSFDKAGDYLVRLSITEVGSRCGSTSTQVITILPPPEPALEEVTGEAPEQGGEAVFLEADAGPPQFVREGDPVLLHGTARPLNMAGLTYIWRLAQGPADLEMATAGQDLAFTAPWLADPDQHITLVFELRVALGAQLSAPSKIEVEVGPANLRPDADAGLDLLVDRGLEILLDGTGSEDPEGRPLTYAWTLLDGDAATLLDADSARPTLLTPLAGTAGYVDLQLTVSDGRWSSSDSMRVWLQAALPADDDSRASPTAVLRSDAVQASGISPWVPLVILGAAAVIAGFACVVVVRRRRKEE